MTLLYLDHAASTPIDPEAAQLITDLLLSETIYGNSSAIHHWSGQKAHDIIETARQQIAQLLNVNTNEIIWTSGATESNNLAIKGLLKNPSDHMITMSTEHKSILTPSQHFKTTYLDPEPNGLLNLNTLEAHITPNTKLISIMHVNNETGIIQDIAHIAKIAQKYQIPFHVDAVQSAGKLPLNLKKTPIDLLSLSAHKMHGPKGVGALFVKASTQPKLHACIEGYQQEFNLRAGTLSPHQIMGIGIAAKNNTHNLDFHAQKAQDLKQLFIQKLKDHLIENVDQSLTSPYILNACLPKLPKTALPKIFSQLAFSQGTACSTGSKSISPVLKAMKISDTQIQHSYRFSWGKDTTKDTIIQAANLLKSASNHKD